MSSDEIKIPEDLSYTKDHEWVRRDGKRARVGITDFAQHELGDIVFVELPEPGRKVEKGEGVAVVESVKSVSDVYSPATGVITANNPAIEPARVNSDPYGEGWFFEVEAEEFGELLTAADYKKLIGR